MRYVLFFAVLAMSYCAVGQNINLCIQPVFSGEKVVLDQPMRGENGDSITISTLKFYIGNFRFWKNAQVVFSEKTHRLIDLAHENSLCLGFIFPEKTAFDSLTFDFGTDSLTNISGAMGGDLDPTLGMFWTWQSGYINCKIEGYSSKCLARDRFYTFHLGGFTAPFQTVHPVVLPFSNHENAPIAFDLTPFFNTIDWTKKSGIMSPCSEAVVLSGVLAHSFIPESIQAILKK